MTLATRRIPYQLAQDLNTTLARLCCARMVDPRHAPNLVDHHSGCEVCTCERRLDWLIGRIPR